jgi:glutathione S-transferase
VESTALRDEQPVREKFTVADIMMTHVLGGGTDQNLLKPYANVLAYQKRCTERQAWKRTLDAYCARVEAG